MGCNSQISQEAESEWSHSKTEQNSILLTVFDLSSESLCMWLWPYSSLVPQKSRSLATDIDGAATS
jgi:hypothetical protein